MKIKILYNQEAGQGGGIVAPSPAPSAAAPAAGSQGGTDPQASFASQLQSISSRKAPQNAQPASDGKNTEPQAKGDEGANGGHVSDDPGTTADGGLTDPEGKGAENKWSEDDLKWLEAQGHAGVEWSPHLQKIVKSSRELRSEFDRVSGSNANAITQAETMRQAVWKAANGDVKALQEAFGVDLKLDQRTPDVIITEIVKGGEEIQGVLQGILDQFREAGNAEGANATIQAWNAIAAKLDAKVGVIQAEKDRQALKSELRKELGGNPSPKDAYAEMMTKATTNLAALAQEDDKAPMWFKAIEDATKPGGALAALGVDLNRAYGSNLETARFFNRVGKALVTLETMPQILANERKQAEADFERKQAHGGPRGTTSGGSARGQTNQNPAVARLQSMFTAAANQRS